MLECPQCGEPEIWRGVEGNTLHVIFGCMLYVRLDPNKSDIENQQILDEWKRTGGLEKWLQKPLDQVIKENGFIIIKDKRIVEYAKRRFDEMWKKGEPISDKENSRQSTRPEGEK